MATIKPFRAIRPSKELVHKVAALPYDVYNRAEAREAALKEPVSFLNIDRPETQFPEDYDMYAAEVYEKAASMLKEQREKGIYVQEEAPCFYLYELTMDGRSQTGLVACASIDDYQNQVIKKHENTREEKEQDRIRHVDTCSTQTGPIFLAYRRDEAVEKIVASEKAKAPVYDFVSEDGIGHKVWIVSDSSAVEGIAAAFGEIQQIYIADGHHRAASAVKVGLKRRAEAGTYTGKEEFNFFLSVLFPENELKILPYYRVVKDLNGNTTEEFLAKISEKFTVEASAEPVGPEVKGEFGMFLADKWYRLTAKPELLGNTDPVKALDVSILQDNLLEPVLGIADPRIDKRIDFVGGIRGLGELERRVHTDMTVAFSTCPTSILELFAVSDAGLLMPPKSTWFEPKLRSGIFLHEF
ncbi:MAG: DUF1015 domain-containing protein [Lachnospiraceae bacterium]|nr:DUF1015 domain-containing protein [Lachnospiraceae bacterium]